MDVRALVRVSRSWYNEVGLDIKEAALLCAEVLWTKPVNDNRIDN